MQFLKPTYMNVTGLLSRLLEQHMGITVSYGQFVQKRIGAKLVRTTDFFIQLHPHTIEMLVLKHHNNKTLMDDLGSLLEESFIYPEIHGQTGTYKEYIDRMTIVMVNP